MNINWDDVPDDDLTPIGEYRLRVKTVTDKVSKNGNDMWELVCEVTKGPHRGATVLAWMVFADNAMWKVKQMCKALGVNTKGNMNLQRSHVMGKEFFGEIGIRKGDERDFNEIRKWSAISAPPATTGADNDDSGLDEEPDSAKALRDFGLDDDEAQTGPSGDTEEEPPF